MEQARALDCFERAAALGGPRFDLLNDLKLELSFVLLHETLKFVQLLGVDSAWGAAETWTGLCRKSTKLRSVSTEPAAAQAALSESYLALHFRSNFMAPPPSGKTFEVVDVLDLFRKLEWEWDRMRAVSLHDSGIERSYLALNAAMTAWHMTDWLCARFEAEHYKRLSSHASIPIDNCKVFRKWVLENRFVSMCEQIAVAGKHFQVDVRPHAVDSSTIGASDHVEA
ncbi:hypothetical protein [Ottowia sp.]|uniref:hypothetical protein n=1 Tax=Ottowia sp. TaxID=1898956 RepID=UPI0025F6D37F|nr:hypothetical protein [Ottowia sp.]